MENLHIRWYLMQRKNNSKSIWWRKVVIWNVLPQICLKCLKSSKILYVSIHFSPLKHRLCIRIKRLLNVLRRTRLILNKMFCFKRHNDGYSFIQFKLHVLSTNGPYDWIQAGLLYNVVYLASSDITFINMLLYSSNAYDVVIEKISYNWMMPIRFNHSRFAYLLISQKGPDVPSGHVQWNPLK